MLLKNHGLHEIIYYLQEIGQVLKDNPNQVMKILRNVAKMIDNYVPYHDGHSLRVSEYALAIAKELKFDKEGLVLIEASALLHDIGKVEIDEELLTKTQRLSIIEKREIEKHSLIGYFILATFIDIIQILDGVKSHHEWWDGSGYPYGLKGIKIPLIARILAVADAYDAMTSYRPYRFAYSREKAIVELEKFAGIQFDAKMVRIFLEVLNKLNYSYC
jgi:putative nucleotidyltransferase with HDIG domain